MQHQLRALLPLTPTIKLNNIYQIPVCVCRTRRMLRCWMGCNGPREIEPRFIKLQTGTKQTHKPNCRRPHPPESSGTPHASVAPGPAACQLRANVPRTARSGSSLRPAYSYTQRSRLYGAPRLIRSRKEGRDLLKLGESEPLASHLRSKGGVRALRTHTRAPRHAALKAGADAV